MRLLLASALLVLCVSGCATSVKFEVVGPTKGQLSIGKGVASCTIPCKLWVETGTYKVILRVPASYAKTLGEQVGFSLYGYLTIGKPTNNSKFAFVQLKLADHLLVAAQRQGKVIETYTYDTGAKGAVLVRIKLGNSRPW